MRNSLLMIVALLLGCQPAGDHPIEVRDAYSPATPPTATVAAVYAVIHATQADRLMSATTPVAQKVEMHSTSAAEGMMQMRQLGTLEIASNATAKFERGGLHFMLIDLQRPLVAGEKFSLTLRFQNAGEIVAEVTVVEPGTTLSHH